MIVLTSPNWLKLPITPDQESILDGKFLSVSKAFVVLYFESGLDLRGSRQGGVVKGIFEKS